MGLVFCSPLVLSLAFDSPNYRKRRVGINYLTRANLLQLRSDLIDVTGVFANDDNIARPVLSKASVAWPLQTRF